MNENETKSSAYEKLTPQRKQLVDKVMEPILDAGMGCRRRSGICGNGQEIQRDKQSVPFPCRNGGKLWG